LRQIVHDRRGCFQSLNPYFSTVMGSLPSLSPKGPEAPLPPVRGFFFFCALTRLHPRLMSCAQCLTAGRRIPRQGGGVSRIRRGHPKFKKLAHGLANDRSRSPHSEWLSLSPFSYRCMAWCESSCYSLGAAGARLRDSPRFAIQWQASRSERALIPTFPVGYRKRPPLKFSRPRSGSRRPGRVLGWLR
jgi:hypothetical protein